jgi:peptidoglycan LD-endopeptidase LytH
VALQVTGRARLRVLLIVVVTVAALAVLIWKRTGHSDLEPPAKNLDHAEASGGAITKEASATPTAIPTPAAIAASPAPAAAETPPPQADEPTSKPQPPVDNLNSFVGTLRLIIPVSGVKPNQLLDTFADARSEGRVHDAIDIPAPAGTPVLAAADGEIIKLFQSERGGTTIYQLSNDRKLVFYYAHLQRYADGLVPGKFVKQGDVVAYVGDTGNAGAGNFHLHFSIAIVADPKRYWEGTNINPFPLLRN